MHDAAAQASSLVFRVKLWMTSPFSEMSLNSSRTQRAAQTQLLRARARAGLTRTPTPPPLSSHPVIFVQLFFYSDRAAPSCHLLLASTLHGV